MSVTTPPGGKAPKPSPERRARHDPFRSGLVTQTMSEMAWERAPTVSGTSGGGRRNAWTQCHLVGIHDSSSFPRIDVAQALTRQAEEVGSLGVSSLRSSNLRGTSREENQRFHPRPDQASCAEAIAPLRRSAISAGWRPWMSLRCSMPCMRPSLKMPIEGEDGGCPWRCSRT